MPEAVLECETVPLATVGEAGTIEEFVQLGLTRNPRIREAKHQIEAARQRVPQVISLPDPVLSTTTFLAPVETAAGQQAFALSVSQKFTNRQRRATRAAIVGTEIAAAKAHLLSVELETAERIRSACWQLVFIRESIEITRDDADSLMKIARLIEQQYEVKRAVTQQDILNVQVEQSKVDNRLTELLQKERTYQARLSRLLHIDPRLPITILDQLQSSRSELNLDQLIAQAVQTRPDLQAQLAVIQRDCKKTKLARLENKPDFTVGVNWIATSSNGISPVTTGDDALSLGVGFNLPVYKNRIRAGICEAHANRRASESRLESMQDDAVEEVFDLVAKIESTIETFDSDPGGYSPKITTHARPVHRRICGWKNRIYPADRKLAQCSSVPYRRGQFAIAIQPAFGIADAKRWSVGIG
jgi:cobalt-zinc-cadmium efflux system outer membrane protein